MAAADHRRRRLTARGATECALDPVVKDHFVTKLLCRDTTGFVQPYCSEAEQSHASEARSLGLDAATGGFSAGIVVVLLMLTVVLVAWCRRWTMLRRLGRVEEDESEDPERPPRSSLLQRRRRRRLKRLLRLRRQHVHFNEDVDVNEFFGTSATTMTSASVGRPAASGGRPRHGSIWVSGLGGETSEEDEEEALSEPDSASHPETSTEDDKNK